MPRETEEPDPVPLQEAGQTPLQITPEQDAAFRAIGELNAIPLESFATVRRFETAWDVLSRLHSYPLPALVSFEGSAVDISGPCECGLEPGAVHYTARECISQRLQD